MSDTHTHTRDTTDDEIAAAAADPPAAAAPTPSLLDSVFAALPNFEQFLKVAEPQKEDASQAPTAPSSSPAPAPPSRELALVVAHPAPSPPAPAAAPPPPPPVLDDSPELRDRLMAAWEDVVLGCAERAPTAPRNLKTAFEGPRFPLSKESVTGIVGAARLALRNRDLAAKMAKSPLIGGVVLKVADEGSTRIPSAIAEELAAVFAVPLVNLSRAAIETIVEKTRLPTPSPAAAPAHFAFDALLRVLVARPSVVLVDQTACELLEEEGAPAEALVREALASKVRPNFFVFAPEDRKAGGVTHMHPSIAEVGRRFPRRHPFMSGTSDSPPQSGFSDLPQAPPGAMLPNVMPMVPGMVPGMGPPGIPRGLSMTVVVPENGDMSKVSEILASVGERLNERLADAVADDEELQRIQREEPEKFLSAVLSNPKAAKIVDEVSQETAAAIARVGAPAAPAAAPAVAPAVSGAPTSTPISTPTSTQTPVQAQTLAMPGSLRPQPSLALPIPSESSLPWPPAKLDLSVAAPSMIMFLQSAKIPLRRIAQLSSARVATATFPRFATTLHGERKHALHVDINKMEAMGITIRDAVTKLWNGERNEAVLTEGLAANVAVVVRALLLDTEAHIALYAGPANVAPALHTMTMTDSRTLPSALQVRDPRARGVPRHGRQLPGMWAGGAGAASAFGATASPAPSGSWASLMQSVPEVVLKAPTDVARLAQWRKLAALDLEASREALNTTALLAELARMGLRLESPLVESSSSNSSNSNSSAVQDTERSTTPRWRALLRAKVLGEPVWADVLRDAVLHDMIEAEDDELGSEHAGEEGVRAVRDNGIEFGLKKHAELSLETVQFRKQRTEQELKALCSNKYEEEISGSLIEAENICVTWDKIGGLAHVKELLRETSVYPMRYPELYTTKGPKGVLLFGPPGTGKTMLAKAVATESGANFISVDSTTIGSKWYGESEKYAKAVFTLARKLAPCVIFIDEIDSLLSSRDDTEKSTIASVKTTLMREWDGLGTTNDRVMVMGATNRPFSLDEAILRRLPRRVMVDLPDEAERLAILKVGLEGRAVEEGFDLADFAHKKLAHYSGSDIHELCREAILRASHEKARELDAQGIQHVPSRTEMRPISRADFEAASGKILPSVAADSTTMAKVKEWDESYGETGRERGTSKPLINMYS